MSPQRTRLLLAFSATSLLLIAALATRQPASGQAAVSLSRPGQEDLSFWVNHNGLLQHDAEGELGFRGIPVNARYERRLRYWHRDLQRRTAFASVNGVTRGMTALLLDGMER